MARKAMVTRMNDGYKTWERNAIISTEYRKQMQLVIHSVHRVYSIICIECLC